MLNKKLLKMVVYIIMAGIIYAQEGSKGEESTEYAAIRLFRRAQELLDVGEIDRGVKMMESILDQYPNAPIRFNVRLALGRHYQKNREQIKAIEQLRYIIQMGESNERDLTGEKLDMYLEALYLSGVCYFDMRQYDKAFPLLRKITSKYPNTIWANQAYYYIGMAHFVQKQWDKAIKNLRMVGTFIDPNSPLLEYIEAGQRLFVKVVDGDLPLLYEMGIAIKANIETTSGDKEIIILSPLSADMEVFVGSINTEPGVPVVNDGILQIRGGDKIKVIYIDDNTVEGNKDVPRIKEVKVVSTATMTFTTGTYEHRAQAAFIGQPVFLKVRDIDMDVSDGKDTLTVKIVSTYKTEETEEGKYLTPTMAVDVEKLLSEEKKPDYVVRDEVHVVLTEEGEGSPVHTGIFLGKVLLKAVSEGQPVNTSDGILEVMPGDKIIAQYIDELHGEGQSPKDVVCDIVVAGEIDSRPRVAQDVVPDAIIRSRKELVEAEAFLELSKIFKDVGLKDRAYVKADQGLEKVQFTVDAKTELPPSLKERGFKLMWELYIVKEEYNKAMAVCDLFNKMFPESPLVSDALLGIANILIKKESYDEAMKVLKKIIALPFSFAKAEAQFRVAEIVEKTAKRSVAPKEGEEVPIPETAVKEYKLCAERYPDSEFAGIALGKVVDYHLATKDYVTAERVLEKIFLDYQDAKFLDAMLMKWVLVAYRMGNLEKAREKCSRLIYEYPSSQYAAKAKEILQKINERLGSTSGS